MLSKIRILMRCLHSGVDDVILMVGHRVFGVVPTRLEDRLEGMRLGDRWDEVSLEDRLEGMRLGDRWDGMLLAVPRNRRTWERRATRRFGADNWPTGRKLIKPSQLHYCFGCGGPRLPGTLCMACYTKVMSETRAIQKEINSQLGLEPRTAEVAVRYQNETPQQVKKDLRIIEVKRERPAWFCSNLTERVISTPADTAEVKPADLG